MSYQPLKTVCAFGSETSRITLDTAAVSPGYPRLHMDTFSPSGGGQKDELIATAAEFDYKTVETLTYLLRE